MGVIERETGATPVGQDNRFVSLRKKARAGFLWAHSLVSYGLARFPFGDRLAIGAMSFRESDVCLLARLNRTSDFRRRRRAGMSSPSRRSGWFSRHSPLPRNGREPPNRPHASGPHSWTTRPPDLV
jgi:hypothetical protein